MPNTKRLDKFNLHRITIGVDAFAFKHRQVNEQIEFVEMQVEGLDREIVDYTEKLRSSVLTIPWRRVCLWSHHLSRDQRCQTFFHSKQNISYVGLDATINKFSEFKGQRNSRIQAWIALS